MIEESDVSFYIHFKSAITRIRVFFYSKVRREAGGALTRPALRWRVPLEAEMDHLSSRLLQQLLSRLQVRATLAAALAAGFPAGPLKKQIHNLLAHPRHRMIMGVEFYPRAGTEKAGFVNTWSGLPHVPARLGSLDDPDLARVRMLIGRIHSHWRAIMANGSDVWSSTISGSGIAT